MKFYLLNVFGATPESGNQLAVVLVDKELSDAEMKAHTLNFGFSETVFLQDMQTMRIFSPGGELPFAGHPTIGTGYLISQLQSKKNFDLITRRGPVPIEANDTGARLTFPGIVSVKPFEGLLDEVLLAANIPASEVDPSSVRMLNSGPDFLVVPVKSHEALKQAKSPKGLAQKIRVYAVHESSSQVVYVRMFSPSLGIGEDPATGSAACALAGYFQQVTSRSHGSVTIFQGAEINRPCNIDLQWGSGIQIGGPVKIWGEGNLK